MEIKRAEQLANEAFTKYGLTDAGWTFGWINSLMENVRIAGGDAVVNGVTQHDTKRILVDRAVTEFDSEEHFKDTLYHEIAHVLVGYGAGHGQSWKTMAAKLGATPEAEDQDPQIPPAYREQMERYAKLSWVEQLMELAFAA